MRGRIAFLILFMGMTRCIFGAVQFSVTTDDAQGMVGDQIAVMATIVSNEAIKDLAPPQVPPSEYYTVVKTSKNQQQSSSIQIVNGTVSRQVEITYLIQYILQLKKEGVATFPSLLLSVKGETYASQPFQIAIGKEQAAADGVSQKGVSVRIGLNRKKPYQGEQCILNVEVLRKAQAQVEFTNESFVKLISSIEEQYGKSFSITRLFKDKVTQSQRVVNGESFMVLGLSFSLIPLASGTLNLPALPFEYNEQKAVRGRDPFDDFFGGGFFSQGVQQIPRTALSNSVSISVQSLPQPQPADFSNAVGSEFNVNASVSSTSVAAQEAVTLNITLAGSTRPGNMNDIQLPALTDCEIFPPEKNIQVDTTAQGIVTKKKYKYLLIPKTEGTLQIPAIKWSYFDPQAAAYKTIQTTPITLTVTKGSGSIKTLQTRHLTQADIREVGKDIRYIKNVTLLENKSSYPYKQPLFLFLFPLPFVIMIASFLYKMQAQISARDPSVIIKKRAYHIAEKELDSIRSLSAKKQPQDYSIRISEIILQFISQRYGFSATGKTREELISQLSEVGIDKLISGKTVQFLETIDTYRFSGTSSTGFSGKELADKASALIREILSSEKRS